jgi:cysteine rich repeat protein
MTKLSLIALALGFLAMPAEAQYTPTQRQACEQDAYRFCQDAIPDEQRVRQCLVRNMRRLSPPCRRIFHRSRRGR